MLITIYRAAAAAFFILVFGLNAMAQITPSGQATRTTIGTADVCLYTEGTTPQMTITSDTETSFTWYYAAAEDSDATEQRTTTGLADSLTVSAPGIYSVKAATETASETYTMTWLSPAVDGISYTVDSITCDGIYATILASPTPIYAGGDTLAQELSYQWEVADSVILTSWATEVTIEDMYDEGELVLRAINQAYNEGTYADTIAPVAVKAAYSYTDRKEKADNESVEGTALSAPSELEFTNESLGAYTVSEWKIGSIARLYDVSPVYQFQDPGTFTISLTVTNEESGCASTDSSNTITVSDAELGFPEAFTPNGDGVNDLFMPAYRSIKSYSLTIYNRWGRRIFSSNDPSEGWDGKEKGRRAAAGTYYYIATAEGYEKGVSFRKHGSVTLIR